MQKPENDSLISEKFGSRLRVRVCGILLENNKVLMIGHKGIDAQKTFWSPPGGGVEFSETIHGALKREFEEETGLTIEISHFLGYYEYLNPPLHAIEFFFQVKKLKGTLKLGNDPELHETNQIIDEIKWFSDKSIYNNEDNLWFHPVFDYIDLKTSPLKPFISTNSRDLSTNSL